MQGFDYQYVIVGGGFSGVHCASILAAHQQSFILLEAENRLGGRTCTTTLGAALQEDGVEQVPEWAQKLTDLPIQCGGTWVSEDQPLMNHFIKKYGLQRFEQRDEGLDVVAVGPKKFQKFNTQGDFYKQYSPQIDKLLDKLEDIERQFEQLRSAERTPVNKTQLMELCEKYACMSAYYFILEQVEDEWLAGMIGWEADCLCGNISREYPVMNLLGYETHLGNLRFCMGRDKDDLDGFRVSEGVETLARRWVTEIKADLDKQGNGKTIDNVVKCNTPVVAIKNSGHPVVVSTKSGANITCSKVLMCVPSSTAKLIQIEELSEGKRIWVKEQNPGRITRMNVVFPTPFWRPQFSGQAYFSHEFPIFELVDLSPRDGSCGIISLVFAKTGYTQWLDKAQQQLGQGQLGAEERKKRLHELSKGMALQLIADSYLEGDSKHPLLQQAVMFTRSMSDYHHIQGTYDSTGNLGMDYRIAKLGQDPEHARTCDEKGMVWMGSDFSSHFNAFMEGALQSARRKTYAELGKQDPLQHLLDSSDSSSSSSSSEQGQKTTS